MTVTNTQSGTNVYGMAAGTNRINTPDMIDGAGWFLLQSIPYCGVKNPCSFTRGRGRCFHTRETCLDQSKKRRLECTAAPGVATVRNCFVILLVHCRDKIFHTVDRFSSLPHARSYIVKFKDI